MNPDSQVSRRDFLKLGGVGVGALAIIVTKVDKVFAKSPDFSGLYPELKKENLPSFYGEILKRVSLTGMTEEGVCQIEQGVNAEKRDVTVAQTYLNKRILGLSEKNPNFLFVSNQSLGLAWHWFGDLDGWKKIYAPNGTVKEYVDNGFGRGTSTMFLVGDEIPGSGDLTDKVSIAQCELPNKKGVPVQSAHILPVNRDDYTSNQQYFALALNKLGKEYFPEKQYKYSILQRMYNGDYNIAPNKQLIGIEILGTDFDNPEHFPSIQKIANVLSVSIPTIKHYDIEAAYNSYGHQELDLNKGDPGKCFTYLMKTLLGVYALANKDEKLSDLLFSPFMTTNKDGKEAVQRYFDFIDSYFKLIVSKREYDEVTANINYQELKKTLGYLNPQIINASSKNLPF